MSWEIVKRCPWGQLGAKPYRLFYSFGGEALKIIELKLTLQIPYLSFHSSVKMTGTLKTGSYLQLASTDGSALAEESDREEVTVSKGKSKKRIGAYSFYLKHLLGSGYGGSVYRGIKDNNKSMWYAIKVIKTKDMQAGNSILLKNQISILQELDHPNIMKLIEVLYSNNHCYIITEYCEGGDLEKYVSNHEHLEWGSIIHQLANGCQYLASRNVVHRDLKPANIFLKDGLWKIGDFGFAKKISHAGALIIEGYKVGSPLYMPLQTLEGNMYSIKSDSFSLGVMIFYLISRKFPYHGKDVNKLIKCVKTKQADFSKFETLPIDMVSIIRGLIDSQMRTRVLISQTDFSVFLTHKSIGEINAGLLGLKGKITEQVILCQFINYLMKNSVHFLQDDHILYSLMSDNLCHLTQLFQWQNSKCLRQLKQEYVLPCGDPTITDEIYRKIAVSLASEVDILKFRKDSSLCQVAVQKLLEYNQIVRCILQADMANLSQILKNITLHQHFANLAPNLDRIEELMATLGK